MTTAQTNGLAPRKPLRLWPGVVLAVLVLLGMFGVPIVRPDAAMFGLMGGVAGGLAVVVWWVFFSRAPWSERVGAIVLMIVALFATSRIVHPSIANAGMGMLMPIMGIPVMGLALVAAAVVGRRFSTGLRRASMVVTILLASSLFALLRTGGITGAGVSDLHWRWTQTPEERLLAQAANEPAAPPTPAVTASPDKQVPDRSSGEAKAPASSPPAAEIPHKGVPAPAGDETITGAADAEGATTEAEWPGFRGPVRDSTIRGVRINTDWSASPPVAMWRRPIGPGWSSFAVRGDVFYTQEQRGEDEIVAAYRVSTAEPVWRHRDHVRFWESNGGAGPRATPALANGRVYAMGATGVLNALDARTGALIWSRNAATDTGAKLPGWGFSGSPLVVDDLVVVATSGKLGAFDVATGTPRWIGPAGLSGYSSPQLMTIAGTQQIVLLNGSGANSVAPADGKVLWQHAWENGGAVIVQPVKLDGDDVLINGIAMTGGSGVRRLTIAHGSAGWTATERWTSAGLKPYFNDFVVHNGHAYGFDGSILACIDLADGKRKWKGGRYGEGQLVALADSDLLLVLSEDGELALVSATPDKFTELARMPAIEGKTWNHPVVVGDVLLIRNGEEMAAFRLPAAAK